MNLFLKLKMASVASPANRSLPATSGTVTLTSSSNLATEFTNAAAGSLIDLGGNTFTLASTLTINKGITFTNGTITGHIAGATLTVNTTSAVAFNAVTINNNNTSSVATCIGCAGTGGDLYVHNCTLNTNEFAITTAPLYRFQITNNLFAFLGTPDSHRYIGLYGARGECIIKDNTYVPVGAPGSTMTRFILVTAAGSDPNRYEQGFTLYVKNNTATANFQTQQFFIQEVDLGVTGVKLIFEDNYAPAISNGAINMYSVNILNNFEYIAIKNNNFEFGKPGGSSATASAMVKLDAPSSGSSGTTTFYLESNTYTTAIDPLSGFVTATDPSSNLIAYRSSLVTIPALFPINAYPGSGSGGGSGSGSGGETPAGMIMCHTQ